MTLKEFRRMKIFALRMTRIAIGGGRWQKVVREHVSEILYRMDSESFSCHWSHTVDWDNKTRLPDDDGTCGFAWNDGRSLLCDFMSNYCWDNELEIEKEDRRGNFRQIDTKVGIALRCCIRAAVDTASKPSAGVVGFTIGDLKKMWAPKRIPKWVCEAYGKDLNRVKSEKGIWL